MSAEKNPLAAHFGEVLRDCRARAGISQETLAELLTLHRTEIGLLERGGREPRLSTIVKLASALSIPPEDLLRGISWRTGEVRPDRFDLQERIDVSGK